MCNAPQAVHALCAQLLGRVRLFATPWTVGHQAPLSMGFSRQEYCSGLPFSISEDPVCVSCDPGIQCVSPVSPALTGGFFTTSATWEAQGLVLITHNFMYVNFSGKQVVVVLSVAQPCPALCDPTDCRPPGSSVHGILQVRIREWVAISFSRGSSQPRD